MTEKNEERKGLPDPALRPVGTAHPEHPKPCVMKDNVLLQMLNPDERGAKS